jgi:hypothetical protein
VGNLYRRPACDSQCVGLPAQYYPAVTATEPAKPPDFFQTAARAGLALLPSFGGAAQVIYEDVRANIAYRQWQTIQEIAENVGEAALTEQLADDPVRQALFVNGVESPPEPASRISGGSAVPALLRASWLP